MLEHFLFISSLWCRKFLACS